MGGDAGIGLLVGGPAWSGRSRFACARGVVQPMIDLIAGERRHPVGIDRRLGRLARRSCAVSRVVVGVAAVAVTGVVMVGSSVMAVPADAAEGCVNEAVRVEQGAAALALPDCRAYEMVSPPGSVPAREARPVAAADGQRFGYYSLEPFPGSDEDGLYFLATRGSTGWSVQNAIPPQGGLNDSAQIACFPSVFYSSELTAAVLSDGWGGGCEGDDPPLVAGESRGWANLFLHDNEDGAYRLIDDLPEGAVSANARLWDATPDLGHVVFSEEAAPEYLYEWVAGVDRVVSVLPDGEAVQGVLVNAGNGWAPLTHAMSGDGETVFFYFENALYARLHAGHGQAVGGVCSAGEPEAACTVQVDAAVPGAVGPGGGGVFMDASEDGSRVFFTDANDLTVGATARRGYPDLYEYDLQSGGLTDLTVDRAIGGADVLGYSGASADGSYLYFVAEGVLTGAQTNSEGASAVAFEPNLYVLHEGVTTFIATLEESNFRTSVSSDGQYFVFNSVRPLTGYYNEPREPQDCEGKCPEVFLYEAVAGRLSCVSCAPNGEAPTGPAEIPAPAVEMLTPQSPDYLQRSVLDDGRVFFDSGTPLVGQAVNGEVNVYEYENGGVNLISSGTGSGGSNFLDASASGEDVFFATGQGLVQGDTDDQASVYDARVDGGFPPRPGEVQPGPGCESGEACKPPPSEPPAQLFAASTALSGSDNLAAPPVPLTPSSPAVQAPGPGERSLTRAQKLAGALAACARQPRRRRAACRAAARRRFGAKPKRRSRSSRSDRRTGHSMGRTAR